MHVELLEQFWRGCTVVSAFLQTSKLRADCS